MAKHERNRAIRIYHGLVTLLLLLGGGALLGLGIWLELSDNSTPLGLDFNQDTYFDVLLHTGVASIVAGGFLLLASIAALISLSRKCVGLTFRVVYVLMAVVIALVLVAVCVVAALLVHRKDDASVQRSLRAAWETAVERDRDVICGIERRLECRGFLDGQCALCVSALEPTCTARRVCAPCGETAAAAAAPLPGCYNAIVRAINRILLPVAIVAAVLALMQVADILFTCCL